MPMSVPETSYPVDGSVQDDHLAVQAFESAEAEIAVREELAHSDCSRIDAGDEGARGRDLEQGMQRYTEMLRERRAQHRRRRG